MRNAGPLVVVGGHEDKEGERTILKEVARRAGGKLVVATVASRVPEEYFAQYHEVFTAEGVAEVVEIGLVVG